MHQIEFARHDAGWFFFQTVMGGIISVTSMREADQRSNHEEKKKSVGLKCSLEIELAKIVRNVVDKTRAFQITKI